MPLILLPVFPLVPVTGIDQKSVITGFRIISIAKKFKDDDGDLEMMRRVVKNSHDSILWIRPSFKGKNDNLYHFENGVQIFGHSYTRKPIVRDHFVALDTIGHGRESKWTLSAVILPEKKIVQVTE